MSSPLADFKTLFAFQAMKDAALEKASQQCYTLIGCFVPLKEYLPLVLAQADAATDTVTEGAHIAVLSALTRGAGRPSALTALAVA